MEIEEKICSHCGITQDDNDILRQDRLDELLENALDQDTLRCPFCNAMSLKFAANECNICDALLDDEFWERLRRRLDPHEVAHFIDVDNLNICCINDVTLCKCDFSVCFIEGEQLAAEKHLDTSVAYSRSCDSCIFQGTSKCAPYAEWLYDLVINNELFEMGKREVLRIPFPIEICENFIDIDGGNIDHFIKRQTDAANKAHQSVTNN